MNAFRLVNHWIGKSRQNILLSRLFAVLGIDILVKLSGIILLPIFLRLMTQQEFGLYSYLLSIVQTFAVVLNFGLYIPLTKFYHDNKDESRRSRLIFTIFLMLLICLFVTICIIYLLGLDHHIVDILFKNPISYNQYRTPVMIAMIVTVLNFMLTSYFFTSEKINEVKKYNLLRIICINGITIALLYFISTQDSVTLRLKSTYAIESVLLIIFSSVLFKKIRVAFDWKIAISSIRMAYPIMISAIFGIVINFGDKFFLEKYRNLEDLSIYYLAISFAGLLSMIFTSLQNAWLPIFLGEKDITKNFAKTKKLMRQLGSGFLILSIFIWFAFKILLFTNIIPAKYEEVIYVLPILLLSQIIATLVPLYSNYLIYFEKTYIASITGLVICFIIYGASMWLIPRFGIYGAAVVSLIANSVYFLIYIFVINQLVKSHLRTAPRHFY